MKQDPLVSRRTPENSAFGNGKYPVDSFKNRNGCEIIDLSIDESPVVVDLSIDESPVVVRRNGSVSNTNPRVINGSQMLKRKGICLLVDKPVTLWTQLERKELAECLRGIQLVDGSGDSSHIRKKSMEFMRKLDELMMLDKVFQEAIGK